MVYRGRPGIWNRQTASWRCTSAFQNQSIRCFSSHIRRCLLAVELSSTEIHTIVSYSRQLSLISQFTSDVQHLSGKHNVVADVLSRVSEVTVPVTVDFMAIAEVQEEGASAPQDRFQVWIQRVSYLRLNLSRIMRDLGNAFSPFT